MTAGAAFDASFRCGSRNIVTNTADTKAYRLQIGTGDPAYLAYDKSMTDLFNGLLIGPVSTQTQNYNFTTGTDVSCAAKVGDGYSTNTSCQLRTCVGGNCANPQTFIFVPSEEITCTNQDNVSYDVGCNAASPDYTTCLKWLYEGTGTTRNVKVTINGVPEDRYFTCLTSTPPGALGPVKTCSIALPSGSIVPIFVGDTTTGTTSGTSGTSGTTATNYSFQTTAYTLTKDTGKPTGTVAYYTNYSGGVTLSPDQYAYWQKQPITAVITCSDKTTAGTEGKLDGPSCACSPSLTATAPISTATQAEIDQWSLGIPSGDTNIGPDVMTYSRVITNNSGALAAIRVQDSASNISDQSFSPDFGIDSTPPKLTATTTGTSGSATITLSFTDNASTDSGFWKPLSAFNDVLPDGVLRGTTASSNAILYRI